MHRQSVLAATILAVLTTPAAAQTIASAPATISVSGTAEIRVAPNEVNLRLGIETRHAQLDEAGKQNEQRTTAALRFLKDSGIDAKDIQTDYLEIQPHYDSDRQAQKVIPEYYQVRRNIGVRLREVAKFDAVLSGVLNSGVNQVHGIDFRTTELRKHRDAARQQAIRAAKEKAVALAAELDATVGKPQNIHEQTGGGWGAWLGHYNPLANTMSQVVSQAPSAGESPEGNLAIGMIMVTATVQVTFRLE